MSQRLQLEFVSDISCTWCAVDLRNLEQALNRLGDGIEVKIHFRPFELNPQMQAHVRRSGEQVGVDFRLGEGSRFYNTFDAHRLLHWAQLHGRQKELKQARFIAHVTDEGDPSDYALLVRLAELVGWDAAEARNVLASDAYAQAVRDDEQAWRDAGVSSVPTIVFNGRHVTTGAQPPAAFEQVIHRVPRQPQPLRHEQGASNYLGQRGRTLGAALFRRCMQYSGPARVQRANCYMCIRAAVTESCGAISNQHFEWKQLCIGPSPSTSSFNHRSHHDQRHH